MPWKYNAINHLFYVGFYPFTNTLFYDLNRRSVWTHISCECNSSCHKDYQHYCSLSHKVSCAGFLGAWLRMQSETFWFRGFILALRGDIRVALELKRGHLGRSEGPLEWENGTWTKFQKQHLVSLVPLHCSTVANIYNSKAPVGHMHWQVK